MVAPDRSRPARIRGLGQRGQGKTIIVALGGPIAPADIPLVWEHIRDLLEVGEARLVLCDVAALAAPDVSTVDALARLQLTARRSGCRVRLRHPCGELQDLLDLMGLADVVPFGAGSPFEPGREIEHRKPPRRVQEEGDAGDLIL